MACHNSEFVAQRPPERCQIECADVGLIDLSQNRCRPNLLVRNFNREFEKTYDFFLSW